MLGLKRGALRPSSEKITIYQTERKHPKPATIPVSYAHRICANGTSSWRALTSTVLAERSEIPSLSGNLNRVCNWRHDKRYTPQRSNTTPEQSGSWPKSRTLLPEGVRWSNVYPGMPHRVFVHPSQLGKNGEG